MAAGDDAADVVATARNWLAAGAERILLDAAGGPHPGGTGRRVAGDLAAAIAREVPVTLAGGLDPANVAPALRSSAAVGVDVATGVERPRQPEERPRKDPLKVALFAKRARQARLDRPNLAVRPTIAYAGLLAADIRGRWGLERDFGGRFVPETLVAALEQLETAWDGIRHDPVFWSELRELLATFAGRPTPLYRADRLAADTLAVVRDTVRPRDRVTTPERLRLYLKREDLAHTGAHKINNALGQALLTRRLGKTRVIAETGAGQHGVATATACALLGLPCVVYMGEEDIQRQAPNVLRMRALGAEVRSVTSGTSTLKDAINEAMRDWVTNVETTHYVLGSAMGPHPYPTMVRDLQRRIGDEAAAQLRAVEGRLPDLALACVGGGSNAIGLLDRFIGEPSVRLAVAEAAGDGIETGRHAAALAGGSPGILHGVPVAHAPGRRRPGGRGALGIGRARLPGGRAADRGAVRGGPAGDCLGHRPRGRCRDEVRHPDGGHPAGARDVPRGRGAAAAAGRAGRRVPRVGWPDERSCCSGSRVVATRTSRRSSGSTTSSRGRSARERGGGRATTAPEAPAPREPTARPARGGSPPPSHGPAPTAGRRSSRTSWPAIRTPRRASRRPSPRPTPAPTCSRSGCRTRTRSPTARRSSGASAVALGRRDARTARWRSSSGSGRPGRTCRSCRWATPTRSSAAATARPSRAAWPAPARPASSSPT